MLLCRSCTEVSSTLINIYFLIAIDGSMKILQHQRNLFHSPKNSLDYSNVLHTIRKRVLLRTLHWKALFGTPNFSCGITVKTPFWKLSFNAWSSEHHWLLRTLGCRLSSFYSGSCSLSELPELSLLAHALPLPPPLPWPTVRTGTLLMGTSPTPFLSLSLSLSPQARLPLVAASPLLEPLPTEAGPERHSWKFYKRLGRKAGRQTERFVRTASLSLFTCALVLYLYPSLSLSLSLSLSPSQASRNGSFFYPREQK